MTVIPLESLPLGFRFRPTDEELVNHYLKGKIAGRGDADLRVISEVDVCKCEPWDLPGKSLIKSDDLEWFFFAPRGRKYPNGHRSNRSTTAGYWKATGKDRMIRARTAATAEKKKPAIIGIKKTLVFHRGRAPKGERTGWIMHEYRTTEPEFESGHQGSYVLYRLFNKQEEEIPGSNLDEMKERCHLASPSTASPGNLENDKGAVQGVASPLNTETLTSILHQEPRTEPDCSVSQPADVKICLTDSTDCATAYLLPAGKDLTSTAPDNHAEQTGEQDDGLLDVLAQLPDLQPEQSPDGFLSISSPMCPYTDHPFIGSINERDVMEYFDSDIAPQDFQLLNSVFAKTDGHSSGNVPSDSSAVAMSRHSFGNETLPENSWTTSDLDHEVLFVQGADRMDASDWSTALDRLQMDMGDGRHVGGAQTSRDYKGAIQESPRYELQAADCQEMEPETSGVHGSSILDSPGLDFCSVGSAAHYPQYLLNRMEESSSRIDMTIPYFLEGAGGWATAPPMQQFADSKFINPQQGTTPRRIRLLCSVQRASPTQTVGTFHLQSEDQTGSCSSTDGSSTTYEEGYLNATPKTEAGDHMHIQGGEDMRAEILQHCSVEASLTDKFQGLSVDEDTSLPAKMPREANLRQRLKTKSTKNSENMPESPASETRAQKTSSVTHLIWLLLVMTAFLVLIGIWKSLY